MRNDPRFRGLERVLAPGTRPFHQNQARDLVQRPGGTLRSHALRRSRKPSGSQPLPGRPDASIRNPKAPTNEPKTCQTIPARRPARPSTPRPADSEEPSGRTHDLRAVRPDAVNTANGADNAPESVGRRLVEPPCDPAPRCRSGGRCFPASGCERPSRVRCRTRADPASVRVDPPGSAPTSTAELGPTTLWSDGRLSVLPVPPRIEHGSELPAVLGTEQRGELVFRGLSHVRVRAASHSVLPERVEPILSWVFTSLGCSPLLPRPRHLRGLLSRTWVEQTPKRPQNPCHRVSASRKIGWPLSRLPTLPRSLSSSSPVETAETARPEPNRAPATRFAKTVQGR
jgi:hypothetical protein